MGACSAAGCILHTMQNYTRLYVHMYMYVCMYLRTLLYAKINIFVHCATFACKTMYFRYFLLLF